MLIRKIRLCFCVKLISLLLMPCILLDCVLIFLQKLFLMCFTQRPSVQIVNTSTVSLFYTLVQIYFIGNLLQILVKHIHLFPEIHSCAVNVGAEVETEEPMSYTPGCNSLFGVECLHQLTACAWAAFHTYFFLLWHTLIDTYAHIPVTWRRKTH